MTVLRGGFAAKQDGFLPEAFWAEDIFDFSGADESEIDIGVNVPASFLLLISIEHLLRGREERLVLIRCAANLAEKVGQVGLLGECGELGGVVQTHIEETLDTVRLQCAEELAGTFLGKTDAVDLHLSSSIS